MAEWKKIIVSGSQAHLASVTASNLTNNNILVAGTGGEVENSGVTYDGVTLVLGSSAINSTGTHTVLSGSFSGSFTGDGTGLSGLTADSIAFDNITGKPTLISSSAQLSGGIVSSSLQFNDLTTPFTGSFTGSFVGDGTGLTGIATNLSIAGDDGTGTVAIASQTLTINGTANEVTASVSGQTVTIGLPDDVTIGNDLTVTGDLIVNGDQTIVNTANLTIEDKFILINSGSSTATDESGIIFGGSNGSANNGAALIWNGDFNSNDGRLAIANSVNADATSATVNYHLAGVFSGTANDAATAQADHEGNIRVDSSGDIFIYVA